MAYIGSSPTKVVSRQSANIFTYTATANQTAFTGADANGNTLACTPSDIMVHMNGIKLEESDFTASTTTVTLGSGAAAGDEVTITAFVTFETADAYTKSASDTRYVNATGDSMTGDLTTTGKVGIGVLAPSMPLDVKGDNTSGGQTGANVTQTLYDTTSFAQGVGGGIGFAGNFGTGGNIDVTFGTINGIKENSTSANYSGALTFKTRVSGGALTERMRVSSSGHVTTPNQPAFQAYNLGSGASNNNQVFSNTRINIGNHYSTSTGRFTAPVTGAYLFGFTNIGNSGNGTYRYYIRKNGSNVGGTHLRQDTNASGSEYGTNAMYTFPLALSASDYVNIFYIESNNGYSCEVSGDYPQFWGYLIG